MSTFKDLQARTETAELSAREAIARAEDAERKSLEAVGKAEAEVREVKAKAEIYIREAQSRIADCDRRVLIAEQLTQSAKEAARPFLRERDEWWQKVFLTALSATPGDWEPPARVGHAAAVASESLLARAGFLAGMDSDSGGQRHE
jgi:hypothetical protein